jgi:hypothetical protein
MFYLMGLQTFYDKGPQPFLLAASRAPHGITINGILNWLNDYGIFVVCPQFTNVAVGRRLEVHVWRSCNDL